MDRQKVDGAFVKIFFQFFFSRNIGESLIFFFAGMQHQAVARLIAEKYADRDRNEIEFLVIEPKKSNLEPKPTALIFMDS